MVRVRYLGFHEKQLAHRMIYLSEHGSIPEGGWVLHRCDNPKCVNPKHLFLGDAQSNVEDMVRKGRNATHYSQQDIREIRTRYMNGESVRQIAKDLKKPASGISEITNGRSWSHLLGEEGQPTLLELKNRHDRKPGRKITADQAGNIKSRLRSGIDYKDLAVEYGLHRTTVYDILKGKTWRNA